MLSAFFGSVLLGPVIDDSLVLTAERTNFVETGDYQEALDFCKELDRRSKKAKLISIGKSPQGREMVVLILSDSPESVLSGNRQGKKPLVFVQNGIHSGEIEGKDACLILAKEILLPEMGQKYAPGSEKVLSGVDIAILPVFSVDAHERKSPYNRANQNGPKEMGWRVTSQNMNLNRDYVKADAGEMRNLLPVLNKLKPDFFIDNHTTDGGDWQYVVQYDVPLYSTLDSDLVKWSDQYLKSTLPKIERDGFLTAPYFGGISQTAENPTIRSDFFGPRYSTGYMALRNVPSLLVETHVLKDYRTRVLGTISTNLRTWEYCALTASELLKARAGAVNSTKRWEMGNSAITSSRVTNESEPWVFKGYEYAPYESEISGGLVPAWSRKKVEKTGRFFGKFEPGETVSLPQAYVIPQEHKDVIELLKLHGVEMEVANADRSVNAEVTYFENVSFATSPFEGRFAPRVKPIVKKIMRNIRKGDFLIRPGQPLGRLVVHMLEVSPVDSLLNWGFFNSYFEQKEYAEVYALEPIARKMLEGDPALKEEFEKALENEDFAKSPSARLNWFFVRSPYYDQVLNRYPVFKIF